MEKKRALLVNSLTIGVIVLLILASMLYGKLTPRRVTPSAGVLEGFEPAQTTQAPAGPSSRIPNDIQGACKEDLLL